jgi:hypothetical protein
MFYEKAPYPSLLINIKLAYYYIVNKIENFENPIEIGCDEILACLYYLMD